MKEDKIDTALFTKLHKILIQCKNKYVETFLAVRKHVSKKQFVTLFGIACKRVYG